jgi:DNA-directed RNA polymerase subunit H (RpoH/RPB5)
MGSSDSMSWYRAPKHELLTEYQAKRALKELQLDEGTLPLILMSDKAIQHLIKEGKVVQPGDIIQITRQNEFAKEEFLYYRKVAV